MVIDILRAAPVYTLDKTEIVHACVFDIFDIIGYWDNYIGLPNTVQWKDILILE